jgi:hypothetical protein
MITPLPRNKRAKNPRAAEGETEAAAGEQPQENKPAHHSHGLHKPKVPVNEQPSSGGLNNPFSGLEIK